MQVPMQRKGIFGRGTWSPPTVDHPDGMANPVGTGAGYPDLATMPAPKKGPTFLQRLGTFAEGVSNDLLHQRGFQNTSLDQRRAMEMYKQRQADTLAQYEAQQQIAAQYRRPEKTEFERALDAANFDPDTRQKMLRDYVTNRANPMIPMQGMDESGNRTVTFVPRNGAQATQPHPEAVKALLNGEGTDAQFDEIYGPGAAARVRGAGSGQLPF